MSELPAQEEWFEEARKGSPSIRARDERDRRLNEVLDCDDCQAGGEYNPCPEHPIGYLNASL